MVRLLTAKAVTRLPPVAVVAAVVVEGEGAVAAVVAVALAPAVARPPVVGVKAVNPANPPRPPCLSPICRSLPTMRASRLCSRNTT
ncbi:hypothetical protein BC936DRAFT_140707 [Jimgerdemannia flammicorona]|uniref:Uncharacterized protein n=1 Tax=Jimgerdemannia flammicorona TaxID=994334 RepID=A0A433ADK8_9FUNG|nr:hypothetical protein BC936DRAFT_140707 [Jimgerdemannia flammicorona]